jgi:hypothetical protein
MIRAPEGIVTSPIALMSPSSIKIEPEISSPALVNGRIVRFLITVFTPLIYHKAVRGATRR